MYIYIEIFLKKKLFFFIWDITKKKTNAKILLNSTKSQLHNPPQKSSWSDHAEPKNIIKKI